MAQLSRVAERYAKSLLDLANEENQLDAINRDMQSFQRSLSQSSELENLLNNPVVSTSKKVSIFSQLFEKKFHPMTFGFFRLILKKRRESDFEAITSSFIDLYNKQNNITKIKITTAVPVPDSELNELVNKIKAGNNIQKIELEKQIDEDILGGFIAEFDNKIMDQSVRTNLNHIKRRFSVN